MQDDLSYLSGFGNTLQSEAMPGALPAHQNSPQPAPFGLYAEQLNGTGFTAPRAQNRRTWMYRLRPQILDRDFEPRPHPRFTGRFETGQSLPTVMRFQPLEVPSEPTDFLQGLTTFAGSGDPLLKKGLAIHLYTANSDMTEALCSVDGDLLIAPELGALRVLTELGKLYVSPGELLIIPRGVRFTVTLAQGPVRGFVAELFDGHLSLPDRGPVGANGLADERHFLAPVAWYEDRKEETNIVVKQGGILYQQRSPHSPFDVVAWHGNYLPFKYPLERFNSLGSVSWDHPDPSILTILNCPIDHSGSSALDVAVFQARWDVTEHTFRPPFFHRNSAVEFNAVIRTPSLQGPWRAGVFSYTPYLTPHGISAQGASFARAKEKSIPERISERSIWLQFESTYMLKVMPWMLTHPQRDRAYLGSFADYPPAQLP